MESKDNIKQITNTEEELDPLFLMEEILEKLKLLNYEVYFLKQKINKPLSRSYFALKSINPGDQFIYFSTLCFWLLTLCGSSIQGDKKYDDPNTASQNIVNEAKTVGIDINVPINKLRQGYGEYVCYVILKLVNKALELKKPSIRKTKEESVKTSQSDGNYIEIKEDLPDQINQEINYNDNLHGDNAEIIESNEQVDEETCIIKSNIPKKAWMREVEKISSKLKIIYEESSFSSEWRSHIDKIKTLDNKLISLLPQSRSTLENLSEDIGESLERIHKKEILVSKNFTQIISDYKNRQVDANIQIDEFNVLRSKCDKLQKDYEELEEKENELNEKYNKQNGKLVNTSIVSKLKSTLMNITKESVGYDMKIAILNNSINSLRHRGINSLNITSYAEIPDGNLWDETN